MKRKKAKVTSTCDGIFRWTAGVFYGDIDRKTLVDLAAFALTQDQTQQSKSWAAFGEGTWSLFDRKLDVTVGARYAEDDRLFKEVIDPATLEFIQSIEPDFKPVVKPKFDTFNPRLNVAYKFNDSWMMYGNVAKGFRTGQAQPIISLVLAAFGGVDLPTSIDPEELWSYEIGTKGTFMDGRAVLEGAVFYNDWKDIQTLVTLSQQPRVAGLVNGRTAKTTGVELGLTLLPMDGLTLQFTGAYGDAKYTQDIAGTPVEDGDPIVGDFYKVVRLNAQDGSTVWSTPRVGSGSGNCGGAASATAVYIASALKVNGLIAIAFWSMIAVAGSGILGRFLYAQIPRTAAGDQLSLAEARRLEEELVERLRREFRLGEADLVRLAPSDEPRDAESLLAALARLVSEPWRVRRRLAPLRRQLAGLGRRGEQTVLRLARQRALLHRRLRLCRRLHELFHYWHVFHKPFAALMYLFAAIHIGVAWATGYAVVGR